MYGVPHSVAAQQRQRRDRCGGDGGRLMASDMSVTRPCVLCVDDEPRILFALKALLRSQYEVRSEEHTSELQSLTRISYAVFCLKKKKNTTTHTPTNQQQPTP